MWTKATLRRLTRTTTTSRTPRRRARSTKSIKSTRSTRRARSIRGARIMMMTTMTTTMTTMMPKTMTKTWKLTGRSIKSTKSIRRSTRRSTRRARNASAMKLMTTTTRRRMRTTMTMMKSSRRSSPRRELDKARHVADPQPAPNPPALRRRLLPRRHDLRSLKRRTPRRQPGLWLQRETELMCTRRLTCWRWAGSSCSSTRCRLIGGGSMRRKATSTGPGWNIMVLPSQTLTNRITFPSCTMGRRCSLRRSKKKWQLFLLKCL
mmetsp:Transcript_73/g.245  ORF Transcript_73/g.245 Transcript_73/m.245 type:complete len:263 (-) Transcript_73:1656-2444(-)